MVAGLWSCSSELLLEQSLQLSDTPIRIEASCKSNITRAPKTDIQDQAFERETDISVYINTTEETPKNVGNSPIIYKTETAVDNINVLTPERQTYYPANNNVNIYAIYPSSVTADEGETSCTFTVSDSQTENTYRQCDLMYASLHNQPKTEEAVRLQFSHLMSKIIVNATAEDELTITNIKLKNFYRSVVFTPSTGALSTLSNQNDITLENGGAALVPPQQIDDGDGGEQIFIEIVTTLGSAYFKTNKEFLGGNEYSITLTVGRINLGLTASITDWTQDGARQIVQKTTADGYTINYTQSLPFQESFRTNPFDQPELDIRKTGEDSPLVRYTNEETDYDYSIVFFGNNQAGTATMVITGNPNKDVTNNLTWVKSFTIIQATGSLTYPTYDQANSHGYTSSGDKLQVPYENGQPVNWPCTMVCDPGAATFVSTNTNVATVDQNGIVTMHGVGETTIMVSSPANGNYTAASTQYNLEVTKREASTLTIVLSQDTYTYNGMPCTPSVTVYDGEATAANLLSPGIDYTVGYSDNVNAGNASVNITGAGDYMGTGTKTFTINPVTTTFSTNYDGADITLAKKQSLERQVTINHVFGTITYASSSPGIASVSTNGIITAGSTTGTTTITISVTEPTPRNYTGASMSFVVTVMDYDQEFSYNNGNVQNYECMQEGTYLLEVWGASGGTGNTSFPGGGGAYVAGTVHLKIGQKLYVYVGGEGNSSGTGGWNGGGSANSLSPGGGGATDISLCNGNWNSTAHLNSRIIVAGGGGGALDYNTGNFHTSGYGTGGGGGAYEGRAGSGVSTPGQGGTLSGAGASGSGNTSAGDFGYGGNYNGTSYAGAGGGGWYGGGAGGDEGRHGAGGGGSSYLWNSDNAGYYSGHGTNNAPTIESGSKETDPTKFYLIERGKSVGTNQGNGKAKISYFSTD